MIYATMSKAELLREIKKLTEEKKLASTDKHTDKSNNTCPKKQQPQKCAEMLKAHEDTLRLAIESTGLGTFDFYPSSGELVWSDHAKQQFGLPSDAQVDYSTFLAGLHPGDRKRIDQIIRKTLLPENNGDYVAEFRTIGIQDGKERWLAARGRALFNDSGHPVRLVGTTLDITESKQAESEIERLASFPELDPNPIIEINIKGLVTFCNSATLEILEKTGSSDIHAFIPSDLQEILVSMKNKQQSVCYREIAIKGLLFGAYIQQVPHFHAIRIYATDITARKQAEMELKQACNEMEARVTERTAKLASAVHALQKEIDERKRVEAALRASAVEIQDLYDNAPCGYHSLDKNGLIVRINATELRWLGYTEDEIVGRMKLIDLMPAGSVKRFRETFPVLKSKGQIHDLEQELIRKDGTIMPVSLSATAIYDNKGNFVMSRSTAFDITERKEAEIALHAEAAERLRAMEQIRQKDRIMMHQSRLAAMGEMISNIAHQWRQPLNTLGLVIQRLPFFYDTEEFNREFLESSTNEAMKLIQHMSRTIDDFRGFFKIDKEMIAFDVNQVIRQTISLIEASFKAEQVTISICPEGNPSILGFPNEYSQVLLSILHNARDVFSERKRKKAQVTIHSFMEGETVVVTISDNAGGIAEDIIEQIFDPYFTTKDPDKGTGIGLFIAKNIMETSMKGRLKVRNAVDGAEFRIEV